MTRKDAAGSGRLDVEVVSGLLRTRAVGRKLQHLARVTSTNDVALEAGRVHGLVMVAELQTAGRGRDGSSWVSAPGVALTFTVVLAPRTLPASGAMTTMAASIAVASVLREGYGIAAHIKWPNDVLVGRSKIAGILCEARTRGEAPNAIACGIGLNVNQVQGELPDGATSMRCELGGEVAREPVLGAVLNALESALDVLEHDGTRALRRRWESLSQLHVDHRVEVESSGRMSSGVTAGLDDDGALLVRHDDGLVVRVLSGGVRFV